jgi:hypothetical protein
LHLQKRDECAHLLLHRLEPDERVELRLEVAKGQLRQAPSREEVAEPLLELGACRAPQLVAEVAHGFERIRCHGGTLAARYSRAGPHRAAVWP